MEEIDEASPEVYGTMPTNRWNDIEALFDAALDREPDERTAWLAEVCDDEDLREEVLRLLAAHERSDGILDRPLPLREKILVDTSLAPLASAPDLDLTGERLGPYRLIREIGRGGMGTVYLAERADDQFARQVAIKILRREVSPETSRRFRAERQILATLDHPNIATLYDGGITTPRSGEAGRPYLIMEYVDGVPLDAYCDGHRLSTRERLRLFLPVLRAVHDAHQNLVVHRDLKPSNILITESGTVDSGTVDSGTVKLLDFGIAKLLDPAAAGLKDTAPETRTGLHPMTPAYASPEQVRSGPITTASDVYQLGLVLYELLTGRRPYRVDGRTPSEIERVICEEEPPPPSTMVATARGETDPDASPASEGRGTRPELLQKTLRGDLDAIVLTALRKEPDRRYDSAEQLADDIDRYLEGRPVVARPDTLTYRAKTFVRRHRWGVAVATAFLVLLIGYTVTVTVQAQRIQEALSDARAEAEKSEQVTTFLMELFEANNPGEALGDTITARQLLRRGIGRAETLSDQPDVEAQMYDVVGRVYQRLGRYSQADSLLNRALTVRQSHFEAPHPDIAESLHHLGSLKEEAGDYAHAESLLTTALAQQQRLFEGPHPEIIETQHTLATLLYSNGEYDQAEPLFRRTLAMRKATLGDRDPAVISSLNNLGVLLQRTGRHEEAEAFYRQALTARRERFGAEHPKVATSLHNLATLLEERGKLDAAEEMHREALAIRRQLLGDQHPDLASSLHNLGALLTRKGDMDDAEASYQKALHMRRELLGNAHPHTAITLHGLAHLAETRGDDPEAERAYREALTLFRTAFGEAHPYVAHPLSGLGRALLEQESFERAEPLLQEALQIRRETLPSGHGLIGEAKVLLGRCLAAENRPAEAEPLLVEGYQTLRSARGLPDSSTQKALTRLVDFYDAWGKPDDADRYQDHRADSSS